MNIDAMKELLAAVEAGEVVQSVDARAIWPEIDIWGAVCCASQGSTDAALALHGALLPGWDWSLATSLQGKCCAWTNTVHGLREPGHKGSALTPARALLIATLRGKIAEMEGTTP